MDVLDELERRFAAAIEAEQRDAGEGAADAESAAKPRAGRSRTLGRRPRGLLRRRSRRPGRRRLPALPLATGGALAALVALVLALAAGDGGERAVGDADAWIPPSSPELLERAARNAAQAPPPPVLRDGELWYVRGVGVDQWTGRKPPTSTRPYVEGYGLLRRFSAEQWSDPGRQVRMRSLTLSVRPRFARDRAAWEATPRSQRRFPPDTDFVFTGASDLPLSAALFTAQELTELPTEPAALLHAIETALQRRFEQQRPGRAQAPDALTSNTFEAIRELLLLPVSPQQRAGLLRAFGLLPGTRAARIGTDARGRSGVILVYTPRTHPRMPRVLVVDDEDGQLLAVRGPRNSVETTYVVQGVTRDVTALPEGVAPPKARLPRTRYE